MTNGGESLPSDGTLARDAIFQEIRGLNVDNQGRLVFSTRSLILRISNPSTEGAGLEIVAGTGAIGLSGDGGPARAATFTNIVDVGLDSGGNIFLSEFNQPIVRYVTPAGRIERFDLGPSCFQAVFSICAVNRFSFDQKNNLIVSDSYRNRVFSLSQMKQLSVFAGTGVSGFSGDGGAASLADFRSPGAIVSDRGGNAFISDVLNHRIRRISPPGVITTIAGSGSPPGTKGGFSGDGGPARDAQLRQPGGIAIADDGLVYFADSVNSRIRALIPCAIRIQPGPIAFDANGGDSSAAVSANEPGCAWTVSTEVPWITFSTPINGNGGGSVSYRVQPNNTTSTRTATIRVANVSATITQTPAGVFFPRMSSAAQGASFEPGVVPGAWVVLTGTELSATIRTWTDTDFAGNRLPTVLDGVSVKIGDRDAFIYFISPTQLNILAPSALPVGPTTIELTNRNGKATMAALVKQIAPAFFLVGAASEGLSLVAAIHTDGVLVGEPGAIPGAATRPAKPGDSIAIFGTGFGPTNPAIPDGLARAASAALANEMTVFVGGQKAQVDYAGIVGPGLVQVNIRVPEFLSRGRHAIVAAIGGVESPQAAVVVVE